MMFFLECVQVSNLYIYIFSEFCGCYYIYIYQVSLLWFLSFSINSEMFGQKLFFTILIYIFWSCSHDEPSGGPWQRFHFGQLQQHVVPLQLSWIKERFWVEWNCWVDEFSWHFIGFHAILWWMFNGFYMVLWWTCEIHELLTWVYVWIYGGLMADWWIDFVVSVDSHASWCGIFDIIWPVTVEISLDSTNLDGINLLRSGFNLWILSGWWFQPLWKIWKSVGMIIPNIWKIIQMFQTANQL